MCILISKRDKKALSKTLSYILRHHPEDFNLKMEIDGTVMIDKLVKALREDKRFEDIKINDIEELVKKDPKSRFSLIKKNEAIKLIRANYGHSIAWVNIDYNSVIPPKHLYHGTNEKNSKKILEDGIKKMNRNYVHLSKTKKQAVKVGKRRTSQPVILKVNAQQMYEDGHKFFKTDSDILLTKYVDKNYIDLVKK